MMTAETYQRARRPDQKLERRDAILGAARELALRDGVRAVSLADIAGRVGIHKSALLRYFETREQIFLELTAQAWQEWTAGLHAVFDDRAFSDRASGDAGPVGPAAATDPELPAGPAARVAVVFADSFASRPLLCDLIAHTPLNLERNVSVDAVRRYKQVSLGAVDEAAGLVRRALPALTAAECTEFVATVATLAGATWQMANPSTALAGLYASDPDLAHACIDLRQRLRRTGEVLLAGLIESRGR
jgi:AcrR family transcriptional regulator